MALSTTDRTLQPYLLAFHPHPELFHNPWALANALRNALPHLADLLKDEGVRRLLETGPAPSVAAVPVSGRAGMSASATVLAYPAPAGIQDHLRLLRYVCDPVFYRGRNRAPAAIEFLHLCESQQYLISVPTTGDRARMASYWETVWGETPARVRARVSMLLRNRGRGTR